MILEEVRDCSSGVDGVLFFVPSSDYRLCEILRSLVRKFAQYHQKLHKFRTKIQYVSQNKIFYPSKFVCALDNIN